MSADNFWYVLHLLTRSEELRIPLPGVLSATSIESYIAQALRYVCYAIKPIQVPVQLESGCEVLDGALVLVDAA